ncbi:hypothetical protein O181_007010 [Austropuccinia psidii MF-1]|uniref:Uncharacterized protein n=1 Tax=Austropuccinia psidii MF-1 TaxID=1389203 RepID=A0A9Q3BM37_9BASI|nr:hypothetical protein [Austropuccinia psidii MF-1]
MNCPEVEPQGEMNHFDDFILFGGSGGKVPLVNTHGPLMYWWPRDWFGLEAWGGPIPLVAIYGNHGFTANSAIIGLGGKKACLNIPTGVDKNLFLTKTGSQSCDMPRSGKIDEVPRIGINPHVDHETTLLMWFEAV